MSCIFDVEIRLFGVRVELRLLGKIPCHTDHVYDFGGNIGGRQAINMGFRKALVSFLRELTRELHSNYFILAPQRLYSRGLSTLKKNRLNALQIEVDGGSVQLQLGFHPRN